MLLLENILNNTMINVVTLFNCSELYPATKKSILEQTSCVMALS